MAKLFVASGKEWKEKCFEGAPILFFAILSGGLLSCSLFERHPESGYGNRRGTPAWERNSNPEAVPFERQEKSARLKTLENSLETKKELEQYSKALPLLKGTEERIEFLSLPGFEARQKWIKDQKLVDRTARFQDSYHDIIEAQDIALGMTQPLVKKSWGEPTSVEFSGNPQFRNERWKYSKYVSTPDGFRMENKLVYFEAGRVVGWEVE